MNQPPSKTWWLLAACGVLDAAYSGMSFFIQRPDGSLALRTFVDHRSTLVQMGVLALAAGVCLIGAGIWTSRTRNSWLLVLNGLACGVLGSLFAFWTGPVAFRTIALLIVAMALSAAIYELAAAGTGKLLRIVAGVVSVGFALAFLGFVFRWIKLNPESPAQGIRWVGSFFGFTAICMLMLGLAQSGQWTATLLRNPKPAH